MIITSILTLIAFVGTLTIVAYLRQVEDAMAEVQEQLETPLCPICQSHHPNHSHAEKHSSLRSIKSYYKRQKTAARSYYKSKKAHQKKAA